MESSPFEIIIRTTIIFLFILITFRISGEKHLGELTPFDFVLLLIISEAVQNALIDDDHSVTAGLICVATLIILNTIVNRISFSSKSAEKLIEGTPKVLIYKGRVHKDTQENEKISDQELYEALRQEGVLDPKEVYLAAIETSGKISVVKKKDVSLIGKIKIKFNRLKARR